jgi:hypothetical protein
MKGSFFDIVCSTLVATGARSAVKYLSPTLVFKATYRFEPRKGDRQQEIVVTFGKPNYAERQFIAMCKKAGEPLPVKKVQLRFWPKKKATQKEKQCG